MRKLLFLFLLSGFCTSTFGQNKYFHELKGMEDSAGVTHLFFNMYNKYQDEYVCGDRMISYIQTDDNIHHFSTSTGSDSVLFEQYNTEYCGGYNHQRIFDYTFYDQNPGKWLKGGVYNSKYAIQDYAGNSIGFFLPVMLNKAQKSAHQEYVPEGLFLTLNQDSLFIQTENNAGTLRFPGNGADWPSFNGFNAYGAYTDSVAINWDIIAQHPAYDSLYFARDENHHLFRTESGYPNFAEVDTHQYSRNLVFNADSTHLYSLTNEGVLRSGEIGAENSWEFIPINFTTNASNYLTIDHQAAGHLFISDSTNILYSENFGDSFSPLTSMENEVAGLYKKPGTNSLYVLTRGIMGSEYQNKCNHIA